MKGVTSWGEKKVRKNLHQLKFKRMDGWKSLRDTHDKSWILTLEEEMQMKCKEEKGEDHRLSCERECLNCFLYGDCNVPPRKLRPIMGRHPKTPQDAIYIYSYRVVPFWGRISLLGASNTWLYTCRSRSKRNMYCQAEKGSWFETFPWMPSEVSFSVKTFISTKFLKFLWILEVTWDFLESKGERRNVARRSDDRSSLHNLCSLT
jgi:hypothetical protein